MKKLLVILTIIWGIGTGSFFAGSENINACADKINTFATFLTPYHPVKTWIEAGLIGGAVLLTMLWMITILRKPYTNNK